jgi:hypothetical protein
MRPLVLVFRQLAQITTTPTVPDLSSVIVGPCYVIKDYPEDALETLLSTTYGRLNDPAGGTSQYTPPLTGSDAVTLVTYPGNVAGALVDHSSVKFTLKNPRIAIGATYSNCGTNFGTNAQTFNTTGNENKVTVSGADFVAAGVKPGDQVILTSSDATQTVLRTVLSVGEPDASGTVTDVTTLRLTANLPTTSVKATGSITAVAGSLLVDGQTFTLNDGVNAATIFEFDSNSSVTGGHIAVPFTNGDSAATVAASIRTAINNVTSALQITASAPVGSVVGLTNDNYGTQGNQTITETVVDSGFIVTGMSGGLHNTNTWIYDNLAEMRVERVLVTQDLADPLHTFVTFPEAGTDKCVIRGGITLGITVGTTVVQKPLSFAELYVSYRALRQDLTEVDSLNSSDVIISGSSKSFTKIGKIDARNPLAVGCSVALQNSGSAPINFIGVQSNDAAGHLAIRDAISSRRDLYCFIPLTQDLNVIAGYKFDWENMASPDYAIANGVSQVFRIVIGNLQLPQATTVTEPSITGEAQTQSGSDTNLFRTLNFSGSPTIDISSVVPGDIITIGIVPAGGQWATRRGTHKVAHVNSTTQLELEPSSTRWNDAIGETGGGTEIRIVSGITGIEKFKRTASLQILDTGNGVQFTSNLPTQVGGPYRVQYTDVNITVPTVTISGFDITVNVDVGTTTYNQIITAINSDPVISSLITASLVGSNGAIASAPSFASLTISSSFCQVGIVVNDTPYIRLSDSNAKFFTNGVKIGDTVEIPVNPNDYSPTAFSGRVLTYKIAQIISENLLLVQNLGDDKAASTNELPHFYARDVAGLLIDNSTAGSPSAAQNYRVRRLLTRDEQVLALIAAAAGFRSSRVTTEAPTP